MAIKPRNGGNGGGGGRGGNGGGNNQGGDGGGGDDGGDGDGDDITELVNAAVSSQIGRKLPAILAPLVAKAMEAAVPAMIEQIQAQVAQGAAGGGAGGAQGQGGGAAAGAQGGQRGQGQGAAAGGQQGGQQGQGGGQGQDAATIAMQRKLDDMERKLKAQADEAVAREAESRNARRDAMLTEGLSKLGVDKNRMRGALAIARESMVWDGEAATPTGGKGAWVWRAQRDGYTDDLPVDKGLGEWGKTTEGMSYIAAQQGRQGGNGQIPQRRPMGGQGQGPSLPRTGGGGGGQPQGNDPAARESRKAQASEELFNLFAQGGSMINIAGGGDS